MNDAQLYSCTKYCNGIKKIKQTYNLWSDSLVLYKFVVDLFYTLYLNPLAYILKTDVISDLVASGVC